MSSVDMEGEGAVWVTDGAIAATLTTHGVLAGEGGVVIMGSTSATDEVAAKAGGSLLTSTSREGLLVKAAGFELSLTWMVALQT